MPRRPRACRPLGSPHEDARGPRAGLCWLWAPFYNLRKVHGLSAAPTGLHQPPVDLHRQHARRLPRLHAVELLGAKARAHSSQAPQVARTNGSKQPAPSLRQASRQAMRKTNTDDGKHGATTCSYRFRCRIKKRPSANMRNLKLDPPCPPHSMLTSRGQAAADKDGRFQIRRGQHSWRHNLQH